jgi:hypothetical protein
MSYIDPQALRNEANRLRRAAEKLDEAADVLDDRVSKNGHTGDSAPAVRVAVRKKKKRVSVRRRATRVDQMKKLIQANGPLRRRDLKADGIPAGSIATYLKPEHGFRRRPDGRWGIADEKDGDG